ncbi:beta-1,6-N-acetylglucosaminyltransferase [Paracoccus sp. 1_MG-2023]|uniref:beta-1,6-N-acetylglucosaminyltransferase n=1 Tax=unclassified Paracoccus (in: a-proteobacteria) TaxID=2688777 RepID=UPI001C08FE99|nr:MULTISPECIES: beta-1,6-N-acetylglucosaminyltransferase [unclassified Paracoccus (in: a-proteobacteria)]MBU2957310.1 beta-1,6-N-acetylglucosaminyltransferase [Paracoccus sp. C2R09]MDO6669922.1 beta-1,6-N-acetylglucosaminyltransferase [Paracoccus sp. 1_MG-2023]
MTQAARLGVVLLCHAQLDIAARMARIWVEGGARVAVHVDAKAPRSAFARMKADLADLPEVVFSRRRQCDWGRFNLVAATQDAAELLLERFPDRTHVFLASGSCLPLRPVRDLAAYLGAHHDRDHIESVTAFDVGWTVGGLNEERFTLFYPLDWRRHRWAFDRLVELQRRLKVRRTLPKGVIPHLGSQWWCLTASTLRAILSDPKRPVFDRYFRLSWIPDESYFQTLARRHSLQIESRSLTLAKFDHEGRPYQLYDDHARMLEESHCFVARKVWPGAKGLLAHFPRPAAGMPDTSPPRPERFERVINRTVRRRLLGRPGLYMQSRFPRKDAENGKTSAEYAVFHGFSDIFPGFEPWLARAIDADVHGHLMGPEMAEFAGRPEIGPGAISSSTLIRDRDPQGFLTSLIRVTPRMQAFQFSPRDNQALNWFMATDSNATINVVTGAWLLPLLDCDMPFDDIRRVTAILQRAELENLNVLNSVWVKARVQIHELTDFLARPQAVMMQALQHLPQKGPAPTDLPAMRDMTGLSELLRRLRNSGLQPRMSGDGLPVHDIPSSERTAAE